MALRLRLVEGDSTLGSEFTEPVFDLFQNPVPLRALFSGLSKYGLTLRDVRFETTGTIGDVHLLIYLLNFSVSVRVRLDRIEMQCVNLNLVGASRLDEITRDVFRSIKEARPDLAFKTHILALNLHGTLEGGTSRQFLSNYAATVPDGLGPKAGNGAVFYFGPDGSRLMSSVTIDVSVRVPEGLFLRLHSTWDGQKVEAVDLPREAANYTKQVLDRLELLPPEG